MLPPLRSALNLRLPPFAVLPLPQRLRFRVAHDMARLRIDVQRMAGAVGDVAALAEEGALVCRLSRRPVMLFKDGTPR